MFGAIAGAVVGGLLNKGNNTKMSPVVTPFESLPTKVQEVYLNTYLPGVLDNYNAAQDMIPKERVQKSNSIFDSSALYALQKAYDSAITKSTPVSSPSTPINQNDVLEKVIKLIDPNFGLHSQGLPVGFPTGRRNKYPVYQQIQSQIINDKLQGILGK